ncbi:MAG: efflux RND transporter periplasmic adaptor subunit [Odoribacter sp.]|nr:efflux RND transporter periplasmic adaptor subunit [Odoribacter sp.]
MIKNIILSALAIAVLAGCSKKKEASNSETAVEAIPVKVQKLAKEDIFRTLDYTANLEADEQVFYAPAATGRISKIYVEVGDRIKKGQVLVDMDKTNLKQAEVQLKNLETEYNRAKLLNETQSISKQAYDAAVTNYEVAKTNIEFLRENTQMLAPFNGVVTGKYFENGEVYTGGAFGGASKPSIIAIEKINPLKAKVNLSEQYFLSVKKGTKVELKSSLFPDRVFEGTVNIVYPTIDPASRTFTVEVRIPNEDEALRPGMYGTINFFIGNTETIVAPAIAVLKLQGANDRYVFVNRNGKAKRVAVTLGKRFEDKVELISNELEEGDELIVVGQGRVVDGSPISITK